METSSKNTPKYQSISKNYKQSKNLGIDSLKDDHFEENIENDFEEPLVERDFEG